MEDSKPRQTRRRLDERTWRAVLERFDGAAMTVQALCLREGLPQSVLARRGWPGAGWSLSHCCLHSPSIRRALTSGSVSANCLVRSCQD